jgi:YEATS domain-containing protein 4
VVERAPFEVTETGWGEFVIEIKVHFVDAREAPVTLQHQLKLFHEGGQPSAARKPVVSEHFDEFVFSEPFEPLYRALVAGPSSRFEQHPLQQYFNAQQHGEHEQRQVARLAAIQKDVSARFDALRKRLFDANAEVRALARQLGLPDEPAPEPALPAAVATAALSAAASSAPSSTPAPAPAPSAADPAPS